MRTITLRPLQSYRSSWANAAVVIGFLTVGLFAAFAVLIALASLFGGAQGGAGVAFVGLFAAAVSAAIFPAVLPVLVAAVALPVLAFVYGVHWLRAQRAHAHHAVSPRPRADRPRIARGTGLFPRATPP